MEKNNFLTWNHTGYDIHCGKWIWNGDIHVLRWAWKHHINTAIIPITRVEIHLHKCERRLNDLSTTAASLLHNDRQCAWYNWLFSVDLCNFHQQQSWNYNRFLNRLQLGQQSYRAICEWKQQHLDIWQLYLITVQASLCEVWCAASNIQYPATFIVPSFTFKQNGANWNPSIRENAPRGTIK